MKKIIALGLALTSLAVASSSFAAITIPALKGKTFDSRDYVGNIVAASYKNDSKDPKDMNKRSIYIFTKANVKSGSSLEGFTLIVDGKDLPFGVALASSVGKKIAVTFGSNRNIEEAYIVTDEFWFGNARK